MKHYMAILGTILLFSTVEVASKLISGKIEPLFLAFLRYFISGLIILAIGLKDELKMKRVWKDYMKLGLIGFAGITISIGLFHTSLQYINAAEGAVIFSINPIFSAFFAWILLKEEFSKESIIGMITAMAGVYLLSFGFEKIDMSNFYGILQMFLSALMFGFYIAVSKKQMKNHNRFFATGAIFLSGAVFYLPFIKSYKIEELSFTMPVILYLAIAATGVAYILYFYGLSKVNVAAGSSMFYLKPIFASILAVIILHEKLKMNFYIGFVIIFIGMFLSTIYPIIKKYRNK